MKNKDNSPLAVNLLDESEFKNQLCFEASYASVIRGGILPLYFNSIQRKRLITSINLLRKTEIESLASELLLFKN